MYGSLKLDRHLLRVGDEVGREIAAVELHAFDDVELEFETLGFLDGDHAFLADLLHRLGDLLADDGVAVGRDDADLGDFLGARNRLRARLDVLDDLEDGEVDAALQVHRVHAGRDRLHALADDRLGEHGRGGGAVTGDVVGLRGHFAQHLRAHVLELVLELDLLGDGDAVLGDARAPNDLSITTLRPFGPSVTFTASARMSTPRRMRSRASRLNFTSLAAMLATLSNWKLTSFTIANSHSDVSETVGGQPTIPRMSDSFMISRSSPSTLTSVPDHLPNRILSPALTSSGVTCRLRCGAGAGGDDFAFLRLFLGGVGDDDPARGLLLSFYAADEDAVVQRTKVLIMP
jgi:hypothetical protein